VQLRDSALVKRLVSLPICCTSSRVGAIISATGPSPCRKKSSMCQRECRKYCTGGGVSIKPMGCAETFRGCHRSMANGIGNALPKADITNIVFVYEL